MGVVEDMNSYFATGGGLKESAKTVGTLGLAWAALELFSYLVLRPYFLRLLDGNPKLAGDTKGKAATATQMGPRVVCFVHNVLQVPLGLMVLTNAFFHSDRMFAADHFSSLVMAISAGYFLYDTVECIVRFEHEGPEFLLHGVFCFIVFTTLTHVRCMHWFGAGFLMWELSTPFVHFRWFLYKIGRDKSNVYAFNGAMGLLVFFLCRICWGPVVSLLFWKDSIAALSSPAGASLPLPVVWFYRVCTVVMNGLNLYWFEKMVRIALDSSKKGGRKPAAKAA
ncbi:flagellar associated protein [Raphidocelis subcapitata]|uniref:Flagellar associated protein n=1 Tax=Raphidocelis subcapitata TaxID=307507 RepID=A0A2V0NZZ6_9CHLO|nr:flagellar associated protein [Raphidocelis subcapitata]|eukprot:GBF91170.1 flagellar associated protein [Raphidocelis subcapitata]